MSDLKILKEKNEENEVFASSKAAMESKIAQIVLGRFDCWITDTGRMIFTVKKNSNSQRICEKLARTESLLTVKKRKVVKRALVDLITMVIWPFNPTWSVIWKP